MSEESGWRRGEEREQRFGHFILQTDLGEVYSLDLYQTSETFPGLAFRGYTLLPTSLVRDQLLRRWERAGFQTVPNTVPLGIEFLTDDSVLNELADMFSGTDMFREDIPPDEELAPYRSFVLPIPERGGYIEMYVEMSTPIRYPERSVWSGTIGGKGNRAGGEFTFLLEQYGTVEPVILLLVAIFFFVFADRRASEEAVDCYRRAAQYCGGERNVKTINFTRNITGMTLSMETSCHFECRDDPKEEPQP